MSESRQLVYLVYGNDTSYHTEACFSVVSAFARSPVPPGFTVRIYTDDPVHYQHLPVETVHIDAAQLAAWAGADNYNHRAKLCVLQAALPLADKTVLIDTDTFFLEPPEALFANLAPERIVFDDVRIGAVSAEESTPAPIAALLAKYQLDPQRLTVVNSGLVGLCREHLPIVERALVFCDVMYVPSGRRFTTEQLALGLSASIDCAVSQHSHAIKHYWSRKLLFRAKVIAFLNKHGTDLLGAAARSDLDNVTPDIPKPPALPRFLQKLASLLVPAAERQFLRELLYGAYPYANEFDRACKNAWWQKAHDNFCERHHGTTGQCIGIVEKNCSRLLLGNRTQQDLIHFFINQNQTNRGSR